MKMSKEQNSLESKLAWEEVKRAVDAEKDRDTLRAAVEELKTRINAARGEAEQEIATEQLAGDVVRETFWKGQLSLAIALQSILQKHRGNYEHTIM